MIRTWNPKKMLALRLAKKMALLEARVDILAEASTAAILKRHYHYLQRDERSILDGHYSLKDLRVQHAKQKKDFSEAWEMFRKVITAPGYVTGLVRNLDRDINEAHAAITKVKREMEKNAPAPQLDPAPEPTPA